MQQGKGRERKGREGRGRDADQKRSKLFASTIMVQAEKPKECTEPLLELISDFSKVAGYKLNLQKPTVFLDTSNEHMEIKTKNTIPFTTVQKNEICVNL